jgi:hypothetical protein
VREAEYNLLSGMDIGDGAGDAVHGGVRIGVLSGNFAGGAGLASSTFCPASRVRTSPAASSGSLGC